MKGCFENDRLCKIGQINTQKNINYEITICDQGIEKITRSLKNDKLIHEKVIAVYSIIHQSIEISLLYSSPLARRTMISNISLLFEKYEKELSLILFTFLSLFLSLGKNGEK